MNAVSSDSGLIMAGPWSEIEQTSDFLTGFELLLAVGFNVEVAGSTPVVPLRRLP